MGRPAYTEFDLEGMFDGEQFADFAVMFAVIHATRLGSQKPEDCWLEKWRTTAISEGTRALDNLRIGVTEALTTLGTGFLEHPDNHALRDLVAANQGATDDLYRWLLRLVYRLIFLFVAEDRDLLHPEGTSPEARRWYADYFSTTRLRRLAERRRAGRHADLWASLCLVFESLGGDGQPRLGLPAYGSVLFDSGSLGILHSAKISNDRLLDALRYLSQLPDRASGTMRSVDYKNLGAEELGSVYEALLEYVPAVSDDHTTLTLNIQAGNARKTSGSYYTPTELVELVLDESLDHVLDAAMQEADPVSALLRLTVCDPACGSGHFLVAAARRIARRVAIARTGDPEPTPEAVRLAISDVVAHCIYGVDLNDLAAELAKVSLWLEALTPGKPLAFLDAHIKVGNALLGATPALLARNIPDVAFTALVGDDRKYASGIKKRNKAQRQAMQQGEGSLFGLEILVSNTQFAHALAPVESAESVDIDALRKQAEAWRRAKADPDLEHARSIADAWCAAFVWPLDPGADGHAEPITHETLVALQNDPELIPQRQRNMLGALARRYRFFHWHLEFPQIFHVGGAGVQTGSHGWVGGFDCLVGNPPWERVKVQDEEFFGSHSRLDIAGARTAAIRRRMIEALSESDPPLANAYQVALREADAVSHLLRTSGRYPLTGRGDVNTYQVFAEHFRDTVGERGRAGIIVPTGIATADTTAPFFASLLRDRSLGALFEFENEAKIFAGVHHDTRFVVLAMAGRGLVVERVQFAFLVRFLSALSDNQFSMTASEVLLLNPNTGTCPVFRSRVDAEITLGVYRRLDILVREGSEPGNPWGLSLMAMLHMANDSDLFRSADDLESEGASFDGFAYANHGSRWLPLYEAKMVNLFDHRGSTYAGATQANINQGTLPRLNDAEHDDPSKEVLARHWVSAERVARILAEKGWTQEWLLGWRDIANPKNARTLIASAIPIAGVGDTFLLALLEDPRNAICLQAVWSALICDYLARQKLSSSHLKFHVMRQVAIPNPSVFSERFTWTGRDSLREWILPRMLELVYTTESMRPYARTNGEHGNPFRWCPERRRLLQAEIDGAMFHIFGLERPETAHVLESFAVLKKREQSDFGEFRTGRMVLEEYDRIARCVSGGQPYRSSLQPAAGYGRRHDAADQHGRTT